MDQEKLQALISRRDELAAQAEMLAAVPESERPKKPSELKAWLSQVRTLHGLVEQMDRLIARAAPRPRVGVSDLIKDLDPNTGDVIDVARIRKGRRAEMRVSVKPWKGRRVIDIRLWSLIDGAGDEMKPSRKGIAFDAANLDALIDALHRAKQHV